MFEALYGIGVRLSKSSFAEKLAQKRKTDLMRESQKHHKQMLDTARKAENINVEGTQNDDEDKDGRGTEEA